MNEAFVKCINVKKEYKTGDVTIQAVDDMSFEINKGEFVVIVGPSGAGKTTILNILGGMDTLTSGQMIVDGIDISRFGSRELTTYRRYDIGFVFQFYNLVPNLTALENVELANQISRNPLDAEQQRVSIARALAKNPKLLLCDEPTGALDYNTGKSILKLLEDTCREKGMTVIVITHNQAITPMADRIISIKNGRVHSVKMNRQKTPVEEIEW